MRRVAATVSGIAAAAVGAALGALVHALVPAIPWLTASLVLGVVAGSLPPVRPALEGVLKPGLGVAARRLLRVGIVVLGLQLSIRDIAGLGATTILAIVLLVAAAFAITWLVARALRLPGDEPMLLAAGFAICGVSAIGAMGAARRSPADDAAAPTALVTLYGTLAIVVLPLLAIPFGLRGADYGRWVGASLHDVGQVVATAGAAGGAVLAVAVVVKLTRVLLLAPMVAVASIATRTRMRRAGDPGGARPPVVPLFVIGFLALVAVRTLVPPPPPIIDAAAVIQSALLATALAAIGAGLRLERLVRSGGRALAAGALSWAAILVLALGTVLVVR